MLAVAVGDTPGVTPCGGSNMAVFRTAGRTEIMTTANDEHADLGRLVADYEATHERVLKLRARLARTAGIWTNFAGVLNQNPEAIQEQRRHRLLG